MEYWVKDQLKIPKLGFGTYMLQKKRAITVIQQALEIGLRHIDTAQIYFNEEEVGTAIRESMIPRKNIFLTTKVWRDSLTPAGVKTSFQDSLNKLKTDYVDLLLIHWPNLKVPLEETLGAFKELKEQNKIRYIGVSNFTCGLLKEAKRICPDLVTNQVEYHPLLSQKKLLNLVNQQGVFLTAYSSLMRGKIFKIQQIARLAEKYKKSPSQIALKWLVEQKNVIALFMSGSKQHIQENFDIFDFELESQDREQIFKLNKNTQRIINPPFAPKWDAL